ncbi:MAG: M56 family metallopeptidase [Bacteroidota bacterium]
MLFSEEFTHAFGWTILHSLWQATLIAAVLVLFLRKLKSASALSRYWAAVAALSVVLIAAIFTFTQVYEQQEEELILETSSLQFLLHGEDSHAFVLESPSSVTSSFVSPVTYWSNILENQLPFISLLWLLGVLFFSMRFGFGLLEIERLRKTKNYAIDSEWKIRLKALSNRLGIFQKVELRESLLTNVPIALGHLKPLILLPIGTINALPIEQVEAILAHELAHIGRKDYLVNLLQSIVEIFFFFNPAVWWMSAQIRMERENCCDDQAMLLCEDKLTYAKALLHLKEIQYKTPALSLSFFGSKNQLLKRVQRILNHPNQQSRIMEKFAVTCLLIITLVFFGLQQNQAAELEMPLLEEEPFTFENILPVIEEEEPFALEKNFPAEESSFILRIDTLPNSTEGTMRINVNENGKTIETKIENGVIQYLEINGRVIPKNEYEEHEAMIQQLIDDLPEPPPAPPAPPIFDAPPAPPSPTAPPSINVRDDISYAIELQREVEEVQRRIEEEQKIMQEKHQQIQKEHEKEIERMHREIEKEHERIQEAHQKIEEEHRAVEKRNTDFMKNLGQNLLEDGLIQSMKNYEFELDNKQLKINGKVQTGKIYEKYKKIIEQYNQRALSRKDRVKIEVSENEQSVHFDFSLGGGKFRNEGPLPDQMLEQLYTTEALFDDFGTRNTSSLHKRKLMHEIGQALKNDQVISDAKRYSFVLNARTKKLVINGQHYPNLQEKYEKMVRHAADFEMSHDFIYEFEYFSIRPPKVQLSNYFPNKHRTYGPNADAYQTYLFDKFAFARELNQHLKQDDLIHESSFKLKINDNELIINGKKQSETLHERYEALFRAASNTALTADFQLAVEQYDDENTSFIVKAI